MLRVTKTANLFLLFTLLVAGTATAADEVPVMGNWQGKFIEGDWNGRPIHAQIVAQSHTTYRAILYVGEEEKGGEIYGKTQKKVTYFEGEIDLGSELGGRYAVTGQASQGSFAGEFKNDNATHKFIMERVLLKSPTLGMEPPDGAVVLMLNENKWTPEAKETFDKSWIVQPRWRIESDGAARLSGSSIVTKEKFGDARYHIEFQTPFMPNDRGQARGNSGVYVEGRYEVQVLDSFADAPADNLCGGIYQLAVPKMNACLPPLEWQTYDITFYAPRFDENGKKIKNAEITVVHNGKVIHDKVTLSHTTPGGVSGDEAPTGPLLLQDHSDRVGYRNVWIKPLD